MRGKRVLLSMPTGSGAAPIKRASLFAALLAACLILTGGVLIAAETSAGTQPAHSVLKVYDGDTILVAGPQGRQMIRLLGIDAPETSKGRDKPGQPYSQKARRYLAGLILKHSISLVTYGEDRYRRTLAVVFYDGRNINLAMIEAGLAEAYRGRTPDVFDPSPYLEAEAQARQAMKGMWRQGANYVSPNRWKHPR